MAKILEFDRSVDSSGSQPTSDGATTWDIWKTRARESVGRLLCRFGFPGFVQDVSLHDPLTHQEVTISSSPYFTKISINGRDYYFDRLNGRFDGTGMGCSG